MRIELPTIYPLTNREISGLSHAEQVRLLTEAGASLIQIREKDLSAGEFLAEAFPAVRAAHEKGARVIINDRIDIAMMTQADGVHLGQGDLPPLSARRILGENAIIGISTHNIEQVRIAAEQPIDYIAFGPIFETVTKADREPVTGLEILSEIRKLIPHIPIIAIGGISAQNIKSVLNAGADSAAVINAVLSPKNGIIAAYQELLQHTKNE
ncbi:MAG: thiamine phosphate synthase [Acidobacteria bacterium]|nr:thiamine phosphate synthase [Acidobacteriota bacterium]